MDHHSSNYVPFHVLLSRRRSLCDFQLGQCSTLSFLRRSNTSSLRSSSVKSFPLTAGTLLSRNLFSCPLKHDPSCQELFFDTLRSPVKLFVTKSAPKPYASNPSCRGPYIDRLPCTLLCRCLSRYPLLHLFTLPKALEKGHLAFTSISVDHNPSDLPKLRVLLTEERLVNHSLSLSVP